MNFFEAQDNARRKTWQLGVLFALAVLALIAMTNIVVAGAYLLLQGNAATTLDLRTAITQVPLLTWLWVSLGVLGVVGLASLSKYVGIRGGGRAIAESLGGRQIQSNTTELRERRLLNVVEEMAIAAGIAVPPVYLINEPGINAFAAGYTPDDAVIGLTDGALNYLNREELQGVIGHEFSHILNGDTRINIRLIALLYGIVFIGLIGGMMLRGSRFSAGRSREGSGGAMALIIIGASLAVIGYAGTFFGNLIKAAVSRQREYLADAAAVQFTRNPTGISQALQKIGSAGSQVQQAGASEISHMFFGQAVSHFLGSIMATHPPLPKRISAIDPSWNGAFPAALVPESVVQLSASAAGIAGIAGSVGGIAVDVNSLPEHVGRPDHDSYVTADTLIETTNAHCLQAARDPCAAHLLIYALLVQTDDASVATAQLRTLGLSESELTTLHKLHLELRGSDELHRLALVELAVPALKQMSVPQYREFVGRVEQQITADANIELFEWVLHRVLLKELTPHFEDPRPPRTRYRSLKAVDHHAIVLLQILATHTGADDPAQAYAAGLAELGLTAPFQAVANKDFQDLNQALRHLRMLAPLQKPKLLKGCAATVLHDQHINPAEGALLQGISATLDCPLPPSVVAKQPGERSAGH